MKRLLSVTEAASILDAPVSTVRRWCARGIVPAERVGSRWRIRVSVLRRRFPGVMADLESVALPTGESLESLTSSCPLSMGARTGRRIRIDEAGSFHTEREREPVGRGGFEIGTDAAAKWLRANDPSLRASAAAKARHAKRQNAPGGTA